MVVLVTPPEQCKSGGSNGGKQDSPDGLWNGIQPGQNSPHNTPQNQDLINMAVLQDMLVDKEQVLSCTRWWRRRNQVVLVGVNHPTNLEDMVVETTYSRF